MLSYAQFIQHQEVLEERRRVAAGIAVDLDKYAQNIQSVAPQSLIDATNHLSRTLKGNPSIGEFNHAFAMFAEEINKAAGQAKTIE